MDNLSHALAGLLLAEGLIQLRIARGTATSKHFARSAYVISAVANNLPDLDFLYARLTEPRPLGYLLHHRGHTHTALGALLMVALFVWGFGVLGARFRRGLATGEWSWLWLLGLVGSQLHIAMDFSNNYGVHPFWPLYDGWLYGDFVFIVEPLFFALGIPPLLFAFHSRLARVLLGIVLVGVVALTWLIPFVSLAVALSITLVSLAALWFAKTQSPARRIVFTFASAAAVVLLFGAMHFRARSLVTAALPAGARLEDVVLTPMPANPFCWSVWRVTSQGSDYVAERGDVATLPGLLTLAGCRTESDSAHPTAPIATLRRLEGSALRWTGRYRAPLRELSALDAQSCYVAAFLRYARVPFWLDSAGKTIVGDLRYDRAPELEFAELAVPESAKCPSWVPGWVPPRSALLH